MQKTIQWILNGVFAIALIGLWLQSNVSGEETNVLQEDSTQKKELASVDRVFEVRYINTDSVWAQYDLVESMRKNLEKRKSEYEADLESSLRLFEKEVMEFQEAAPKMSRFEGEQKQKSLMQKEQELSKKQEELSLRLMDMEDQMKRDVRNRILKGLRKYQEDEVDMVLDFSSNSSLLMIEDSLDITKEFIQQLNADLKQKK
jgi:Skp family chaperone for outer membrane proteins